MPADSTKQLTPHRTQANEAELRASLTKYNRQHEAACDASELADKLRHTAWLKANAALQALEAAGYSDPPRPDPVRVALYL